MLKTHIIENGSRQQLLSGDSPSLYGSNNNGPNNNGPSNNVNNGINGHSSAENNDVNANTNSNNSTNLHSLRNGSVSKNGASYSSSSSRRESSSSLNSLSSINTVGSVNSNKSAVSARSQYSVILLLSSLNSTFDKKALTVPFYPDVLKLGRQTSNKTQPSVDNGFFDSRVLSRQHAEIWAQRSTGKVFIKDVKSSNGTYINGERLSVENIESEPHELKKNDVLELGIDICGDDGTTLAHRKVAAHVDRISFMDLSGPHSLKETTTGINRKASFVSDHFSDTGARIAHTLSLLNGESDDSNNSSRTKHSSISAAQAGFANLNGSKSTSASSAIAAGSGGPFGLTTAASNGIFSSLPNMNNVFLDASLWGDMDATMEDLMVGHANSSIAGVLLKPALTNNLLFEATVKKLVAELRTAKLEKSKLQSVQKLMMDIHHEQQRSFVLNKLSKMDLAQAEKSIEAQEVREAQGAQEAHKKAQDVAEEEQNNQPNIQQKHHDESAQKDTEDALRAALRDSAEYQKLKTAEIEWLNRQNELEATVASLQDQLAHMDALKMELQDTKHMLAIQESRALQLQYQLDSISSEGSNEGKDSDTSTNKSMTPALTTSTTNPSKSQTDNKSSPADLVKPSSSTLPLTTAFSVVILGATVMALLNLREK